MAPCERVEEFSDGALAPEEAEAFRAHLGACGACQRKLSDQSHLYVLEQGLQGKPPAEPEPYRHRARKQHRWRSRPTPDGQPKRWRCLDCPLERWVDQGPRGGPIAVFEAGGVELVRGAQNLVHVPACPPAPKGDR